MNWTAVVLAGSRGAVDPVAQASAVSHKAFVDIAGKPMIAHVLDTLAVSPSIGGTIVVIERSAPELPQPDVRRIDAARSPSLSALAGFEAAGAPVIVTTADHPLLTVDMVEHFLAAALESGVDVAAGIAFRPIVERAGSTARRTYLRFSDGEVSGCNLFALMTPQARAGMTYWRLLEGKRKHPMQMAWSVGPFTLIRYAFRLLSTRAAAGALGRTAGCRMAMIELPFPDAAHDVDKPADLEFAKVRLTARGEAQRELPGGG
jgi:GTP:adenosylcobinamide-phosphate guanylyltransferase